MKKICILFLFCLTFRPVHAQLTITDSLSAADVAALLTGFGVNISNLDISHCDPRAMAEFSGVSEIPITQGLLLTSGYADLLAGANNNQQSTGVLGTPGDADLDAMILSVTYDACVLEFDCVPQGDTLLFNFAFGSEEYPEFVGTFNDVFAILLSGPGMNGTYNAAQLPNGDVVSINNVNDSTNSAYYYDNTTTPGVYTQYDGFTQNLEVFALTYPDSLYHVKIAIADNMDQAFDSGVMLEAFSFRSPVTVTAVAHKNQVPFSIHPNPSNGNFVIKTAYTGEGEAPVIRLFDISGREVYIGRISGSSVQLNLSHLDKGTYILHISGNNINANQQVIIK